MSIVPIVFAIDNNVVMQCGVTITSLLLNAKPETFYDVYILCNQSQLNIESRGLLQKAFVENDNVSISFVDVGEAFVDSEGLASGHITTATYYRLAIPTLFPQFEKVIYSDIDIIFQQDLSELFETSFPNDELVAAVLDLAIDNKRFFNSDLPSKIGKTEQDYFNAGFLLMNLKQMREGVVSNELYRHAKIKYDMNDQDVLNIVCCGRVQFLPSMYNFQPNHFANYLWKRDNIDISFNELFKHATLHYTGIYKPWNSLECVACDTWWHYYKKSPFYEDRVYFKRNYDRIESVRNDFRNKRSVQLLARVLVNWKHKFLKR